MNKSNGIFDADAATRKKLKLSSRRKNNMTDEILQIFEIAEREYNKTSLTIDEITIAYYNMFTVAKGSPQRDKKAITMKLFLMKGETKNDGIIVRNNDGTYSLRSQSAKTI